MNKPDYIIDIDAEQYHADARKGLYLSSHQLADFRKSPYLYFKKFVAETIPPSDSASFVFGRAAHTLTLEGRGKFNYEYVVSDGPTNPKTGETYGRATKAYKEWAATQNVPVIGNDDFETMLAIQHSVFSHSDAATILDGGFAEGTIRTTRMGVPMQIRMDWYDPERRILADLKTCQDLDRFQWDIRDFGYVEQMAYYRDVIEQVSGEKLEAVYIIGVEKKEPYRTGVWQISAAALDEASAKNDKAIESLKQCRATKTWPTGYEGIRVVDVIEK